MDSDLVAFLKQTDPTLIMPFEKFAKGDYPNGRHNLYIVWRGKRALYVGISRSGIWDRWFARGGQAHMFFAQKYSGTLDGGQWCGLSTIGRVIAKNIPVSFGWKVELRHIPTLFGFELTDAEEKLIHELRPLFNVVHRQPLTEKENRLANKLEYGEAVYIANAGTASLRKDA
jgi:hypothetical protein